MTKELLLGVCHLRTGQSPCCKGWARGKGDERWARHCEKLSRESTILRIDLKNIALVENFLNFPWKFRYSLINYPGSGTISRLWEDADQRVEGWIECDHDGEGAGEGTDRTYLIKFFPACQTTEAGVKTTAFEASQELTIDWKRLTCLV